MSRSSYKTHQTSVVAMPSDDICEPIQAIRREHDRQIHRWMPHINLLYPFYPRDQFQAQRVISRAASGLPTGAGI